MTDSHYIPQGRHADYDRLQELAETYRLQKQVSSRAAHDQQRRLIDSVGVIEPDSAHDYIGFESDGLSDEAFQGSYQDAPKEPQGILQL